MRTIGREAVLRGVRIGRQTVARQPHRHAGLPPVVPEGWHTAPPDFVGVGASGAATAWWHAQIERHPAVARAPGARRELRWFDRFWGEPFVPADARDYSRWFPRPEGSAAGEWTPSYLANFWIPEMLAAAAPSARILVMLRDPVARYSAARARAEAATGAAPWDDRDALGTFQRGLYAEPLRRVLGAFPRERLLILQEEACRADLDGQLARTLAFIGLPAAEVRAPAVDPPASSVPHLPDAVRQDLVDAYAPDREQLAELAPELDFRLWSA